MIYLVVWFSGNLEGWNLSSKLTGASSFRQSFRYKIFWSMMKSFVLVYSFHTSAFQLEQVRGGNLLSLLLFLKVWSSWILHFDLIPICGNHILELNNEKLRVFNKCFGVKCLIFVRSPIPRLSFFFNWIKYKSQSRCPFIVRPKYLTCVTRGIYWSLILKFAFRCFF